MTVKPVLAHPEGLEVTNIEMVDEVLPITAISTQVLLLLQVRKCFCKVPDCARKIFVKRLTPFVEPWTRVTQRLYQIVQILGLADFRQTWHPCDGSLGNTDLSHNDSSAHHGSSNHPSRAGIADWH